MALRIAEMGNCASAPHGVTPPSGRNAQLRVFVYGFLKPGELAFAQIRDLVVGEGTAATVEGRLQIRDALPIYDARFPGVVHGFVLDSTSLIDMYQEIGRFEPAEHYKWKSVRVRETREVVNILEGKQLDRGLAETIEDGVFRSTSDPVLALGPSSVLNMIERALHGLDHDQTIWDGYFQLQAAYSFLWSILERFATLRYSQLIGPTEKVRQWSREPAFSDWLRMEQPEADTIHSSQDASDRYTLGDGELSSAMYFYYVRNNLSHRGKGLIGDVGRLRRATLYLYRCVIAILDSYGFSEEGARD